MSMDGAYVEGRPNVVGNGNSNNSDHPIVQPSSCLALFNNGPMQHHHDVDTLQQDQKWFKTK